MMRRAAGQRIVAAALNLSCAATEISDLVSCSDHEPILNGDRFTRIGEHPKPHPTPTTIRPTAAEARRTPITR